MLTSASASAAPMALHMRNQMENARMNDRMKPMFNPVQLPHPGKQLRTASVRHVALKLHQRRHIAQPC